MGMRVAAGLARLLARFGGTAAAQGHRRHAASAGGTSPARCDGGAGRRFRGRGGDRAALHNLLRAQFLVNSGVGVSTTGYCRSNCSATTPRCVATRGSVAAMTVLCPSGCSARPWSLAGACAMASGGCGMGSGAWRRSVANRASVERQGLRSENAAPSIYRCGGKDPYLETRCRCASGVRERRCAPARARRRAQDTRRRDLRPPCAPPAGAACTAAARRA